jgi:glycosyltransferase involved in cell wall biosynthesis
MTGHTQRLKITHFASGDIWAGAEKQLYTLVKCLGKDNTLDIEAVLMNEGELADKLRDLGIPVTVFDESRHNGMALFWKILNYLRSTHPDVVHTHGHKENFLVSIANSLSARARNVRTVHGAPEHDYSGFHRLHKRLLAWLDVWTGNHLCDRVVAVTEELKDKLMSRYRADKLTVIVNGIDIEDKTEYRIELDFRKNMPDKRHIGIAGRLVPVKRVDIFLETAKLLLDKSPDSYHFHVFGDGPLMTELKTQANQLGITNHVTFHGHRQDMDTCLANLDLLMMCSDHEGMPMVALEAIAAGTPVMAHAVGGLKSLLAIYSESLLNNDNNLQIYFEKIEKLQHKELDEIAKILKFSLLENFSSHQNQVDYKYIYNCISRINN